MIVVANPRYQRKICHDPEKLKLGSVDGARCAVSRADELARPGSVRPEKTPGTRLTASQLPGPSRKTLMTVTFRPHRVAMSSGSDVRTVTGPGAAKAVALSIASIACR